MTGDIRSVTLQENFMKHLQYRIDQAGSAARDKYGVSLSVGSSAVCFHSTGAEDPGSVRYRPDNGGSIYTPRSIASGLKAHIAAVKHGIYYRHWFVQKRAKCTPIQPKIPNPSTVVNYGTHPQTFTKGE
ncbi:hypothetical protein BDM02DRAFT_2051501 [Thelephora ganbajun]|uniref:Uncharacterized protein n=1 Tax=Thelephora ganbajun TaxID=370292 RepID=A0ACB6ZGA5_THEGA|nr:hypothetical protein BDM02DRAFT_2051501 [Thelephora ganbajun]